MPTKTQVNLSLPVDVADMLREKSERTGASQGDLAALILRFGFERLTDDAVRAWAAKQPPTRGRLGGGLRLAERAVLAALDRLLVTGEGAWRFAAEEVAKEAGQRQRDGFLALKSLQARGLVNGHEEEEIDQWGRPKRSFWYRVGTDGKPVKTPPDPDAEG